MNDYDKSRFDAAVAALATPIPDNLDEVMKLWAVVVDGIYALGGWLVKQPGSMFNSMSNPLVFEQEPGISIRARVLELQDRWVELNRGERPSGPCPTCKNRYDYEIFPADSRYAYVCGGCAEPCGLCGLIHERSSHSGSSKCIKALGELVAYLYKKVEGHIP